MSELQSQLNKLKYSNGGGQYKYFVPTNQLNIGDILTEDQYQEMSKQNKSEQPVQSLAKLTNTTKISKIKDIRIAK